MNRKQFQVVLMAFTCAAIMILILWLAFIILENRDYRDRHQGTTIQLSSPA